MPDPKVPSDEDDLPEVGFSDVAFSDAAVEEAPALDDAELAVQDVARTSEEPPPGEPADDLPETDFAEAARSGPAEDPAAAASSSEDVPVETTDAADPAALRAAPAPPSFAVDGTREEQTRQDEPTRATPPPPKEDPSSKPGSGSFKVSSLDDMFNRAKKLKEPE